MRRGSSQVSAFHSHVTDSVEGVSLISLVCHESLSSSQSPMLDSGASYSTGIYGMQSRNSDPSSIEKSIARNLKDVNENAASISQVWH